MKIKEPVSKIGSHNFSSLYHKTDLFRKGESFSFSSEFVYAFSEKVLYKVWFHEEFGYYFKES